MPKIFVSYRRDDNPAAAARVRDGLAANFGKSNLFMDVDNLIAGLRFDEELAKALTACDVFIAIIGERWLDLMRAKAEARQPDYVRAEIASALQRKIAVIPVRVGREGQLPRLPDPAELPPEIRDLVSYQKHDVTHENHGRDIASLIEAIGAVRRHLRPEGKGMRWGWVGGGAAAAVALGYVGAAQLGVPVWVPFARGSDPAGLPPGQGATVREAPKQVGSDPQGLTPGMAAADKAQADRDAKLIADAETKVRTEVEAKQKADEVTRAKAAAAEIDRQRLAALKVEEDRQRAAAEAPRVDPALSVKPGSGQTFRDCTDGCPEMVVVPAGSSTIGSKDYPNPPRTFTIRQQFAVGKFEVTFEEWNACVVGGGCISNRRPADKGWGRGQRPVISVSWNDAKEYIAWLSRKTDRIYRLLTDSEWEYAARAGTTTSFFWGSEIGRNNANCDGCGSQWNFQTAPVGVFKSNAFGLHDMHGNVQEWCETADGKSKVIRGGSFRSISAGIHSSNRFYASPDLRDDFLGFRVARTM